MPICKICKEYRYDSIPHKCPPKLQTHIPNCDYDDKWQDTYAYSSDSAATKRAEEYDHDELELISGGEVEIHVKNIDGNIEKFACTGEAVPEYRATKIT